MRITVAVALSTSSVAFIGMVSATSIFIGVLIPTKEIIILCTNGRMKQPRYTPAIDADSAVMSVQAIPEVPRAKSAVGTTWH